MQERPAIDKTERQNKDVSVRMPMARPNDRQAVLYIGLEIRVCRACKSSRAGTGRRDDACGTAFAYMLCNLHFS